MFSFMYALQDPLAFIIRPIYNLIGNYGITLIVVTILIRVCTIPLTYISQKNMSKTQLIQPEMMKLQNKYKNDKDTLTREMNKLYQKHGMSPLSGCSGCLPLFIQMFILFGFIGVIYNPLESILQLDSEKLDVLAKIAGVKGNMQDVSFCANVKVIEKIKEWGYTPIEFNLFGIDLAQKPEGKNIMLWIFPALAFLSTVVSSWITKKQTEKTSAGNEQAQSMSNMMVLMMPVMTLMFIGMMPVAMSLYWFVSTTLQIFQQTVINKFITNKVKAELDSKGNIKK